MNNFDQNESSATTSESSAPLRGRTVVVTRALSQSEEIGSKLGSLGASVIYFPTIEIAPPDSWNEIDSALRNLSAYDWIIFTSANGVRFFFERSMQLNIGRDSFANSAICVIGTATARAVQEFGAAAALTVSDSTSEGTLREFVAHLGGESRVQSLRILIPRARVAREVLPEGLRRLGAIVDAFETYQSVKPNILPEDLARLFKERTIDAITFTSPSTISNFAELAGTKDLSQLLSTTVVACIGPTTARAAESFGLTHVIQPKVHNAAALVDSIVKTFDRA